jgi:hypothetical protein
MDCPQSHAHLKEIAMKWFWINTVLGVIGITGFIHNSGISALLCLLGGGGNSLIAILAYHDAHKHAGPGA